MSCQTHSFIQLPLYRLKAWVPYSCFKGSSSRSVSTWFQHSPDDEETEATVGASQRWGELHILPTLRLQQWKRVSDCQSVISTVPIPYLSMEWLINRPREKLHSCVGDTIAVLSDALTHRDIADHASSQLSLIPTLDHSSPYPCVSFLFSASVWPTRLISRRRAQSLTWRETIMTRWRDRRISSNGG